MKTSILLLLVFISCGNSDIITYKIEVIDRSKINMNIKNNTNYDLIYIHPKIHFISLNESVDREGKINEIIYNYKSLKIKNSSIKIYNINDNNINACDFIIFQIDKKSTGLI